MGGFTVYNEIHQWYRGFSGSDLGEITTFINQPDHCQNQITARSLNSMPTSEVLNKRFGCEKYKFPCLLM